MTGVHSTRPSSPSTTAPEGESVTQLTLGTPNHAAVQHRMRDLLASVEAEGYGVGHVGAMTWLALYADRAGVSRVSLAQLARDRGWDRSNLCRDVRALIAAGYVVRRPNPTRRGRHYEYFIPAMESPVRGL